jgi:Polysaccharide deacetylase
MTLDYFDISLSETCTNLTPYSQHSLHIIYSGSDKFSISLQQHNSACNEYSEPYPETWDSVEAARYTSTSQTDIWVPISHFNINLTRTNAIALESFYTALPTHFYKIELIPPSQVPANVNPPLSVATSELVFKCKVPNTFAFAIDDGAPELAQEVLQILKEEEIKVTFFAVGNGLADESTNLTNVYKEALSLGHQVGLHSWSHPK